MPHLCCIYFQLKQKNGIWSNFWPHYSPKVTPVQWISSVSLVLELAYHGNKNVFKNCPSNETNATGDAFFTLIYLKMAFGAIFQPH